MFEIGGALAAEGLIQTTVGAFGLKNFSSLPPLQQPSGDSKPADSQGPPKPGTFTGSMDGLTTAERNYVQEQLGLGNDVERVPTSNVPTPDFKINGVETELKTVENLGPNTVKNFIEKAATQTTQQIVVDARGVNLSPADAAHEIQRAQGNIGGLQGRVTVLTSQGPVKF